MSLGIPIKIQHEAEGHVVTVELTSGEVYRGTLLDSEDNMNCQLKDVTVTSRTGQRSALEQVYIRGSKIRFIILPDILKNAPMFKWADGSKPPQNAGLALDGGGRGGGRGGRGGRRGRGRGGGRGRF